MMCVSLHYQSKAFASWKHWKSTDVTPNCRLPQKLKYYLLEMKRLLLTLHYGNEMDIFCIAVNEKLFTILHAPTPSLILVLTITQRCLASQIRRDAVLSM
ncbi:hypothetical protein T05_14073 [Trichinella murrelli]|uniref:Uncharacterized protein n=1 Tax=Trichinella murrelli TaxID=144512 RepID=A0A0V0TBL8_9BILA|nr:hypothetical protein T05_14073 [Trichinella murrelli]